MTFAGIVGLLIFIYMRPPEFIPAIASVPFLYLFLAVTIVGIVIDVSTRKLRLVSSMHLKLALVFWLWCLFTLAIAKPSALVAQGTTMSVSFTLFLVIAHGIQKVSTFVKTTLTIFGLGLFVATIAAHQGFQPFTCVEMIPNASETKGVITDLLCPMTGPEGEPQDGQAKCVEDGEPGLAYYCEKPGLLGTYSVQGRVRYLGVLMDPNEVALATSMAIPFAFAFLEQRRSFFRVMLLLITLIVVGVELVFTQSRGGQLVFATVLGAYFIKKYGYKLGLSIAGALAVPLMLLGGRSDEAADQSTQERLEAAAEGIRMMIHSPVWGVGMNQFSDHHYLLPHNAYINAASELGFGGMCLFIALIFIMIKIPVTVMQHDFPEDHEVATMKSLAMAMVAVFAGACIGIFFLTWTYHYVVWIHFGLAGALYSVAKAKDPQFEVKLTRRDLAIVVGLCVTILVALTVQCKRKGAW